MTLTKHVYVVLSDTGTWFTRLIRLYTRAELNHASLSFDENLNEVYSFGRKHPNNPFIGGFVKENIRGNALFNDAKCAVYRCPVSEQQYRTMRNMIEQFEHNAHQYKYNLIGLFAVAFKVHVKRDKAFFCTQFVTTVFEQSGVPLIKQHTAFATPSDLERSPTLELIYSGPVHSYRNVIRTDMTPWYGHDLPLDMQVG